MNGVPGDAVVRAQDIDPNAAIERPGGNRVFDHCAVHSAIVALQVDRFVLDVMNVTVADLQVARTKVTFNRAAIVQRDVQLIHVDVAAEIRIAGTEQDARLGQSQAQPAHIHEMHLSGTVTAKMDALVERCDAGEMVAAVIDIFCR